MKNNARLLTAVIGTAILSGGLSGCGDKESVASTTQPSPVINGISPQKMADAIHMVLEADRATYTKLVINRLAIEEKVIKASEHWKEEKALPLPAQVFRAGAEEVMEKDSGFSYSLLSQWPINKQNKPKTLMETQGLEYIANNPGKNFYGEEVLGGTTYYTAVYPDAAVVGACVSCHNDHKDSPRKDFKLNEIMGGVVIRIPL